MTSDDLSWVLALDEDCLGINDDDQDDYQEMVVRYHNAFCMKIDQPNDSIRPESASNLEPVADRGIKLAALG